MRMKRRRVVRCEESVAAYAYKILRSRATSVQAGQISEQNSPTTEFRIGGDFCLLTSAFSVHVRSSYAISEKPATPIPSILYIVTSTFLLSRPFSSTSARPSVLAAD